MKKMISIMLSFSLMFVMVACTESVKEKTNADSKTTRTETTIEKKDEEPTSKTTVNESVDNLAGFVSDYTVSNEVIVDNDHCVVTLVSGQAKNSGGAEFKFLLENKTKDTTLMFSIDDIAVNGWMVSSLFAKEITPGKKANETLSFNKSTFEDIGVISVDKIEFKLRVYDSNDWSADRVVDDTFIVYPTGKDESQITVSERWKGNNEKTIVENDKVSFVVLGTYNDDIWGYTVAVYLENKTDQTLMYTWKDASIDGYMIDPFWATTITPGNKKIDTISFSKSQLEENGIKTVGEIEFTLRIYDDNNWSAKSVVEETFKYAA